MIRDLDLRQVMARLSAHVDGLASDVRQVEETIGQGLHHSAGTEAQITRLQSLDYLRQSLEDISCLARNLSQGAQIGALTGAEAADLSRQLRLSVTQEILYPQPCAGTSGKDHSARGDLDLF